MEQLESISTEIEPRIQTIFKKIYFLPPSLVRVLSEMEERGFSRSFNANVHPTQISNINEVFQKDFYLFSQQCKSLRNIKDNGYS